jgi:hypothetical protein
MSGRYGCLMHLLRSRTDHRIRQRGCGCPDSAAGARYSFCHLSTGRLLRITSRLNPSYISHLA